jgi:hypothetical protein
VPLARLGRLVTRGRVASTASRYQGATPPDETIRARFDRNDSVVFGFSKIDVMFGRTTLPQARAYYREIAKPSVSFHQKAITSIDPTTRKVSTDQGHYQADVLAAALGADRFTSRAVRVGGHHGGACNSRRHLTAARNPQRTQGDGETLSPAPAEEPMQEQALPTRPQPPKPRSCRIKWPDA